jgi:hypothetical protein
MNSEGVDVVVVIMRVDCLNDVGISECNEMNSPFNDSVSPRRNHRVAVMLRISNHVLALSWRHASS